MKKFVKWTMLTYNILALFIFPLFLVSFLPEMSFLYDIAWHCSTWLSMVFLLLLIPLQRYMIPQIVALVLIGLYANELRLDSYSHSIREELPGFVWRASWTAFSAVYMLLTYFFMMESVGAPPP